MSSAPPRIRRWHFADFELDLDSGQLRRDGRTVPLQDKPFQLLACLVERAPHAVTRDDIRERLWGPDTFVEFDDSLNQAVRKVREALGDSAEAPQFVRTLPKRGYRSSRR
jgi:DNA-binding winged helix-turn-helix (wHTH) protein